MTTDDWQQRVNELESRLAFQDDTIDQLNLELVRQNDRIAQMEVLLRKMAEQMKSLMPLLMAAPGDETPPPHY